MLGGSGIGEQHAPEAGLSRTEVKKVWVSLGVLPSVEVEKRLTYRAKRSTGLNGCLVSCGWPMAVLLR